MVNPATGLETDYEELWRSPQILATTADFGTRRRRETGEEERAASLLRDARRFSSGERGVVVLLGQYCQGFMREGDGAHGRAVGVGARGLGTGGRCSRLARGLSLPARALLSMLMNSVMRRIQILVLGLAYWTVVELAELGRELAP